jgi:hypothetical protein
LEYSRRWWLALEWIGPDQGDVLLFIATLDANLGHGILPGMPLLPLSPPFKVLPTLFNHSRIPKICHHTA